MPVGTTHIEITEHPDRFDVGSYPSPSAYGMTEYFVRNSELFAPRDGERPRVLEIGSGTGAVGLACAALGANVVLTEREALVEQIRTNAKLNCTRIENAGGAARIAQLDWRVDAQLEAIRHLACPPLDLLVGSDLIYPATSAIYGRLLRVVLALPAHRVLFAYPYQRDRAPAKFFAQAADRGISSSELHRDEERAVAIVELFPPMPP